jgi:ketosteroid isomerase-like protein
MPKLDLACKRAKAIEAAAPLLHDWNDALNAHDAAALEKLYTPRVSFYGQSLSRARVATAKRQALAATPGYKQELSDLRFAGGDIFASVTFSKASAGAKTVSGRLAVQCGDDQRFGIALESDAPTDALGEPNAGCEAAMYEVAFEQPPVKEAQALGTDDAPFGGLSYPPDGRHVSAAIGYHHPDHFEAAFFLDWQKGVFTINQGDVPVPPAGQARVKAVCAK